MEKRLIQKGRKGLTGGKSQYDVHFRRKIVKEYLEGDLSMTQLGVKYGGIDRRLIHAWKNQYGAEVGEEVVTFSMTEQEQKDVEALRKQVEALKKKLEYEQMKTFALETMIDLAKTELGVDLRKNSGAKQPKE